MLSTALTMKLSLSQKSSLKIYSVESATKYLRDSTLRLGFISFAILQATLLLESPTLFLRNIFCLFKLDTSMF